MLPGSFCVRVQLRRWALFPPDNTSDVIDLLTSGGSGADTPPAQPVIGTQTEGCASGTVLSSLFTCLFTDMFALESELLQRQHRL